MILGDVRDQVERRGFITVCEPACGAGGMVVACAEAIKDQGINYQQAMHVMAQDIDATAVHMTYLQLSLLHVPAIVIHGNTLSLTHWGYWVTPAHVLGGWDRRLRARVVAQEAAELFAVPEVPTSGVDEAPPAELLAQARATLVAARLEQLDLFE